MTRDAHGDAHHLLAGADIRALDLLVGGMTRGTGSTTGIAETLHSDRTGDMTVGQVPSTMTMGGLHLRLARISLGTLEAQICTLVDETDLMVAVELQIATGWKVVVRREKQCRSISGLHPPKLLHVHSLRGVKNLENTNELGRPQSTHLQKKNGDGRRKRRNGPRKRRSDITTRMVEKRDGVTRVHHLRLLVVPVVATVTHEGPVIIRTVKTTDETNIVPGVQGLAAEARVFVKRALHGVLPETHLARIRQCRRLRFKPVPLVIPPIKARSEGTSWLQGPSQKTTTTTTTKSVPNRCML